MTTRNKLYYPKSHIITNLYTSGKEWMYEDGTEYVGFYHRYIDNTVLSGADYNRNDSKKLIRYIDSVNDPDNAVYNTLKNKKVFKAPSYVYPIPTVDDYRAGKFSRYFLKRRNYSTHEDIMEIDEKQYKLWRRSESGIDERLYTAIEISWKLTGPLHDQFSAYDIKYGVADTNKRIVFLKDVEFNGLRNFLTDYTELTIYSTTTSSEIKKQFGIST